MSVTGGGSVESEEAALDALVPVTMAHELGPLSGPAIQALIELALPWDGESDPTERMKLAARLITHVPRELLDLLERREEFCVGENAKAGDTVWQLLDRELGCYSATREPLINVLSMLVIARTASYGEPYFMAVNKEDHLQDSYRRWRRFIRTTYTLDSFEARIRRFMGPQWCCCQGFPDGTLGEPYKYLSALWKPKLTQWRYADEGPDPRIEPKVATVAVDGDCGGRASA